MPCTEPAPEEPPGGYETVILRALRIVLVLGGVVVFLRLWNVDVFALSQSGFGVEASRALLHVGITVLLAYVGWALAKTAIDRRLALEGGGEGPEPGDEGGGHGTASRLKTLLPLFRRFLFPGRRVVAADHADYEAPLDRVTAGTRGHGDGEAAQRAVGGKRRRVLADCARSRRR